MSAVHFSAGSVSGIKATSLLQAIVLAVWAACEGTEDLGLELRSRLRPCTGLGKMLVLARPSPLLRTGLGNPELLASSA